MRHKHKLMVSCAFLLCTALNILLLCVCGSRSYMYIGAASPILSLMMFIGSNHLALSIISGIWCVGFSLALLVSVILTFVKKYQPFICLMIMDAIWYGVALLYALSIGSSGMPDFVLLCIGACVHVTIAISIWVKFKQPAES